MVLPLAVGVVAVALAPGGPSARPVELARLPATETVQTLAIGGTSVYAATELPDWSVRLLMLRRSTRRTIGAFNAPIPEGRDGYELARITQSLRLAASGSRLAVLRTVRALWRPDCAGRRVCRRHGLNEPLLTELYVARPGSRLKRLMRVEHRGAACALTPTHIAVSGTTISYVARFGEGSACRGGGSIVAVAAFRGESGVLRRVFAVQRDEITALALAGKYVVWATRHPAPCPCSEVVVADWRRGTTHFRFMAPQLEDIDELAVTRDAAVALAAHVHRQGCRRKEIVVLPARAAPRLVGARATGMGGLVGERLVHAGFDDRGCAGAVSRIVLTDVRGRTRVLRRVAAVPSGLDFDGTYVVYALPLRSRSSAAPQVVYRQRVR